MHKYWLAGGSDIYPISWIREDFNMSKKLKLSYGDEGRKIHKENIVVQNHQFSYQDIRIQWSSYS